MRDHCKHFLFSALESHPSTSKKKSENLHNQIKLEEFNVPKHKDRVKGDIAESKVYRALKKYFTKTGDDVIIIHSHKFLNKDKNTNNEKDFIIVNLSKGKSSTS